MMTPRLIIAILSTLLEEAAIAFLFLWLLPRFDIHLPLALLVIIMLAWAGFAVFTYWLGSRALKKKPINGLPDMVGTRGKVVNRLDPDGLVRIKGELWKASSAGGEINTGEEVVVVGQERLKLIVRRGTG